MSLQAQYIIISTDPTMLCNLLVIKRNTNNRTNVWFHTTLFAPLTIIGDTKPATVYLINLLIMLVLVTFL